MMPTQPGAGGGVKILVQVQRVQQAHSWHVISAISPCPNANSVIMNRTSKIQESQTGSAVVVSDLITP